MGISLIYLSVLTPTLCIGDLSQVQERSRWGYTLTSDGERVREGRDNERVRERIEDGMRSHGKMKRRMI